MPGMWLTIGIIRYFTNRPAFRPTSVAVAAPASGTASWTKLSSTACEDGDAPLPFTLNVDDFSGISSLTVVEVDRA